MRQEIINPLIFVVLALIAGIALHISKADLLIQQASQNLCTGSCLQISDLITHLGDGWLQFIICCAFGIFYYKKTNYVLSKAWFYAGPLSLVAGALGQVIKFTFGRPRPKLLPELYDFQWFEFAGALRGFPSGHTLTSFAIFAIVASHYSTRIKIILFAIASIVGLSRITTNSHFAADVVFGAALGYFFGIVLKKIIIKG